MDDYKELIELLDVRNVVNRVEVDLLSYMTKTTSGRNLEEEEILVLRSILSLLETLNLMCNLCESNKISDKSINYKLKKLINVSTEQYINTLLFIRDNHLPFYDNLLSSVAVICTIGLDVMGGEKHW